VRRHGRRGRLRARSRRFPVGGGLSARFQPRFPRTAPPPLKIEYAAFTIPYAACETFRELLLVLPPEGLLDLILTSTSNRHIGDSSQLVRSVSAVPSCIPAGRATREVDTSDVALVALTTPSIAGVRRRSHRRDASISSISLAGISKRLAGMGGRRRSQTKLHSLQRDSRQIGVRFPAPKTEMQNVQVWSEHGDELQRAAEAAMQKQRAQEQILRDANFWLASAQHQPAAPRSTKS
jgi:hypothetical protein